MLSFSSLFIQNNIMNFYEKFARIYDYELFIKNSILFIKFKILKIGGFFIKFHKNWEKMLLMKCGH